jgi:CubicO group peptidase (beta-lactamase class C family)
MNGRISMAGVLICAAASTACTTHRGPADNGEPLPPPNETAGVAIPAGQIDAAVNRVDELARELMVKSGIPGMSVAVVYDGRKVFAAGYGVRKVGEPAAVDADTVFQLASVSKSVGSTVVAHQVGEKAVAWDDPIVKYLRWFKLSDPWVTTHVTIADMYAHRSGLPDHAGDLLEEIGYDRRQILERLRYLPLEPFRSTYEYTNFGVTTGAEAVAAAAHTDWATLSERVLYRPLRMDSTSSRYADFVARSNRAWGHVRQGDAYVARYQRQPDAQSPAGGVSSSANDMAKWLAMVLANGSADGQSIVAPQALLPAITPQIISRAATAPDARADMYGYGFNVNVQPSGRTNINHSGAFALGAGTTFAMIPSAHVGIVVLTNAAPIGVAETLAAQFMDLVQFGHITRDWYTGYKTLFKPYSEPAGSLVGKQPPANAAPARRAAAYTGRYVNKYFGEARVVQEDGALALVMGPDAVRHPLRHWDGDRFVIDMQSENFEPGSVSAVDFMGAGPRANRMTVELLDADHVGSFVRR